MTDSAPLVTASASYADAVTELEQILRELDSVDVDVDHLAERVARAAELIQFCRGRLDAARVDVERIVATLEPNPSDPGSKVA